MSISKEERKKVITQIRKAFMQYETENEFSVTKERLSDEGTSESIIALQLKNKKSI